MRKEEKKQNKRKRSGLIAKLENKGKERRRDRKQGREKKGSRERGNSSSSSRGR